MRDIPRPQTFEREVVLEQAMNVFWRQGFEATSVDDLIRATGLARQSMYNSFGDKRTFFLATLQRYLEVQGEKMLGVLSTAPTVKEGFQRLFEKLVEDAVSDSAYFGCMSVNTATELAPHDAEIRQLLNQAEADKEAVFADAIRRAQVSGEVSADKDPVKLARFLYNTVLGLRVRARRGPDRETLQDIVETALKVLE